LAGYKGQLKFLRNKIGRDCSVKGYIHVASVLYFSFNVELLDIFIELSVYHPKIIDPPWW
jgi:hypothetical protein